MFYMTYSRSRAESIVPYAEKNNIPLMSNAVQRWSDSKQDFLDMYDYDTPRIVDSGGYNVLDNYSDTFPWEVETYHDWLEHNSGKFRWAAAMDYACEEKFDGLFSKRKRMEMTIENTIRHFDLNPSYKVLPVLQGRSYEDYIWSYEQLQDHGIPTNHVGLGTVCRISNESEIVELERKLRENTDIKRIHGFGIKINAFKKGAMFESADSHAWVYAASNGQCYKFNEELLKLESVDMPNDSKTRTIESFKNYYDYVTTIIRGEKMVCGNCNDQYTNGSMTDAQEIVLKSIGEKYCEDCSDSLLEQVATK